MAQHKKPIWGNENLDENAPAELRDELEQMQFPTNERGQLQGDRKKGPTEIDEQDSDGSANAFEGK